MTAAVVKIHRPELADISKSLEAANERYTEIRGRISEIRREIAAIKAAQVVEAERARAGHDRAVQEVLAGQQNVPVVGAGKLPQLESDLTVFESALAVVSEHCERLGKDRYRAKLVSLQPTHRMAAQRIAAALLELVAANAEELSLHRELADYGQSLGPRLGVLQTLPPAGFPNVGSHLESSSPASHWFAYARREKLLK